jgi:hypothetical protein
MFSAASEVSRDDYMVEEPETPVHGGFEIPRGGDEELMHMIESWTGRSAETVALQYNSRGEKLLESFRERHVADLPDGGNKLQQFIHALDTFGQTYADTGGETGSQNRMVHLLKTQVFPIVKMVMRAEAQKQQAHGRPDHIPGRASDERDQRDSTAREAVSTSVLASITGMGEFNLVQSLQDKSRLDNLSVDEELQMHRANLKLIERQLEMWQQANQTHNNAFKSTIARLNREYHVTQKKITSSIQEIHGMGAQAQQRRSRGIERVGSALLHMISQLWSTASS